MNIADGKVVLVLEGGYDLPSLCDSSEACLNVLMNKQLPSFPNATLDAMPNQAAIETLQNIIDIQSKSSDCHFSFIVFLIFCFKSRNLLARRTRQ